MVFLKKIIYFTFFILLSAVGIYANNKPHITNFNREKYHADNKNWSIGQDQRGRMYFGNDAGLLEFDGIEWKLNKLPNSSVVRSVAVYSNQTIFTGSYEDFGRWDRDISGRLRYTSLGKEVGNPSFENADFWKIWIVKDKVYFQSFNGIYVYDFKTVKQIESPKAFLFLSKVRDELWVQEMQSSLFRLKGDQLERIEGSELFNKRDIRVILPYATDKFLIGTTNKGVYIYDGTQFKEWNPSLSAVLNAKELNCGIRSSRGNYFFGTILGGIIEVDQNGNIVNHISSENELQNNTILSLFEDDFGNIWAALDKGIACIRYFDNMSSYIDPKGNTGAVYCGILWNNKLLIGTNQGIFHIDKDDLNSPNALSKMKLINGSQGQVWSFSIIDNRLFCGHNSGLLEVNQNLSISTAYPIHTGVFKLYAATIKGQSTLFVSSYTSLKIINHLTNTVYSLTQISEPITNIEVDHLENVWLEHLNRGVYKCKLDDDLKGFKSFTYYGGNSGDNLPYKLKLFKVGGRILLLGNSKFFMYDDIADKIIANNQLNNCFRNIKDIKQIIHIENNLFWALSRTSIHKFSYDGYNARILESYDIGAKNLALVNTYENLSILNDSITLICLDNGFLLHNSKKRSRASEKVSYSPHIEWIQTSNVSGKNEFKETSKSAKISYRLNTVTINFSAKNTFTDNLSFQYLLKDVDSDWSEPQQTNQVSYPRLPKGKYTFMVRTVDNFGNMSEPITYQFEIRPPWYQTTWAYLGYILLFISISLFTWLTILRRYRNKHLLKIRLREAKRLSKQNKRLQHVVEEKNAELLSQTSFIIQRNELIMKIKAEFDVFYEKHSSKTSAPLLQKINALINKNLDSEDDWKMFLIKFEEKHTGFFKRLKTAYPQLTTNDLRLCACLRLNLDSKEIASLMNVSVRAIENNRYRIRKKLDIPSQQNLNDFFLNT